LKVRGIRARNSLRIKQARAATILEFSREFAVAKE